MISPIKLHFFYFLSIFPQVVEASPSAPLESFYFIGCYIHEKTIPLHNGVIIWKYCPRYWCFVRRIHRSPMDYPHKGQWRGALVFSLISAWTNGWVNNRDAGDLRRHHAHYDVAVTNNKEIYEMLILRSLKHNLCNDKLRNMVRVTLL